MYKRKEKYTVKHADTHREHSYHTTGIKKQ